MDLHFSNSLIYTYAKNGDLDSAEVIFGNLPYGVFFLGMF